MRSNMPDHLSRRERQIMDIIYRLRKATAAEILNEMPDPPSYSAVRAMLRILEEKGHLRHEQDGNRYIYMATVSRDKAKQSALKRVLSTFFEGSVSQAMAALLDMSDNLSDGEVRRLEDLIEQAKRKEEKL